MNANRYHVVYTVSNAYVNITRYKLLGSTQQKHLPVTGKLYFKHTLFTRATPVIASPGIANQ